MSLLGNGFSKSLNKVGEIINSGSFDILFADDDVVLYKRKIQDRIALVAINTSNLSKTVTVSMEPKEMLCSSFRLDPVTVDADGKLELFIEASSVDIFHNQFCAVC